MDALSLRQRDLLLILIIFGGFFFASLGARPLGVPSEARYAEIPREMLASGDYVTPRLNGVKYFEKPPLFYWLQASSLAIFGNTEFAVRFWPAVLGLAGVLLTYGFGQVWWGRQVGLLAAGILATNPLYFAISRIALTDMAVSVFTVASLFFFLSGALEPPSGRRRWLCYTAYAMAALAVLTKGLIGIVIPGMVALLWLIVMKRWREVPSFYPISGLLLFLAIAAPWHILAAQRTPEFAYFYFIHEHFVRFSTTVHHRYEPWWFFIPILLGGFVPWTLFLWRSMRGVLTEVWRAARSYPVESYLLIATGFIFLFFSASNSKLVPYIIPVFPLLSLVVARWLQAALEQGRGLHPEFILAAIVFGILAIAAIVIYSYPPILRSNADFVPHIAVHLIALAAICMVSAALLIAFMRRYNPRACLVVLLATGAALSYTGDMAAIQVQSKSTKGLAAALRPHLTPDARVATYWQYTQDLPFYLQRTVDIVEWKGELEFGSTLEDLSARLMSETDFWKRWNGQKPVFVVIRFSKVEQFKQRAGPRYFVVAQTDQHVVASNRPVRAQQHQEAP